MSRANDPPSVLHCFRPLVGGVFRHVRDLVQEQVSSGFDVGIICDSGPGPPESEVQIAELGRSCGLGVHRLPIARAPGWRDLANARRVGTIIDQTGAELVHGHGAKGGALARLAGSRAGVVPVYSPHGGVLHYHPSSLAGRLLYRAERHLLHRTDGLIFVCEYEAARFEQLVGSAGLPTTVVHNGLFAHEWSFPEGPTPSEPFDFVFVGELRQLKGVATLCGAVEQLRDECPVRVLIVGDGPDADAFRSLVRERGLEGSIFFAPPVPSAIEAFRAGRCVVVPSHAEAFPYVVLEAVAVGRPVVATNVGGIPEVFGPWASRLVPPGDATALADRMRSVWLDPKRAEEEAAELAQRARGRFTVDAMAREISDFYRVVLRRDEAWDGASGDSASPARSTPKS